MAALALLCAPALAEAYPYGVSITRTVQAGPDGGSRTLACHRSMVALGGAVVSSPPEVTPIASVPRGVTGWTFRFAGGPGEARVILRCIGVRPSGSLRTSRIRAATRSYMSTVTAGASASITQRCPTGFVPTGYGLRQSGAARVILTTAKPGRRAWTFRVENRGRQDSRLTVIAHCVARAATARGPRGAARHPLRVRVARFGDTIDGGSEREVVHRCPARHFSIGAGYSFALGDDIVANWAFMHAVRHGRWSFTNPSGRPERVATYLTCLSLRTTFR